MTTTQELKPYDYCDPARLIAEVADRVPLRAGDVYLVVVAHPSTEQRIENVVLLDLDAEQDHYQDACDELADLVPQLGIPNVFPITHAVMTVLVRPGLTVFGTNEVHWMRAWRYSNHLVRCFSGHMILVTEHGWSDQMSHLAGAVPAMVPTALAT